MWNWFKNTSNVGYEKNLIMSWELRLPWISRHFCT